VAAELIDFKEGLSSMELVTQLKQYSNGLHARGWDQFWQGQNLSLVHSFQTGSGAHPASCPVGGGGKAEGVLS
jgi:hypothetical protein